MSTTGWCRNNVWSILGLANIIGWSMRARAWQTKKSRPEARENFLVMKIDFPSLMRYGKSFKNITRTLKQLLLEIILFLWSFSKSHVPNEMSRFWWFSGHKIWTHGPIWLILVGNDSPLWELSYKSVCNNIRQFPKLQEGHKHWFLKGTIIAAIDERHRCSFPWSRYCGVKSCVTVRVCPVLD